MPAEMLRNHVAKLSVETADQLTTRDIHELCDAAEEAILAGGGFKGGYVYGKTSAGGEEVVESPVSIPDFNATIAYALGIPIDHILYSPTKRPFRVAHKGNPVMDLFA
mgnify:CR=1 FL=1